MSLLKKPSLEGILANFNKTLTQLDAYIAQKDTEVSVAAEAEATARAKKIEAAAEIDRAVIARKNIQALVSE